MPGSTMPTPAVLPGAEPFDLPGSGPDARTGVLLVHGFTGTPMAWRPQGSLAAEAKRPAATGDYQAWTPE